MRVRVGAAEREREKTRLFNWMNRLIQIRYVSEALEGRLVRSFVQANRWKSSV